MSDRPIIGITMGDPVGIGPEIVLKALADSSVYDACRPVVLGDAAVLAAAGRALGQKTDIHRAAGPEAGLFQPGTVDVACLSHLDPESLRPGQPSEVTGRAMVEYVIQGIAWALEGRIQGLATGPINKAAMRKAGFSYDGHTEILAEKTNTPDYVMLFVGSRLRVALVTIHVPLARVPERLTLQAIVKTVTVTAQGLQQSFGIAEPRIAVAGLNPHAGEGGIFGKEEQTVIEPAVRLLRQQGIHVSGPHPADALFYWALRGAWDVVIAMYHDQGLIPFKLIHFADGVNTTLGLPIVRTSVDHGTAYDIAGTGKAEAGSMIAAIRLAALQATQRAKTFGTEIWRPQPL